MADETLYTYEGGLVLDRITFEPSVGTPGVFTSTGGVVATTYDMFGLAQPVVSGSKGYYSGFKAPYPIGLLNFGDVPLAVSSLEARDGALAAQAAAVAAAAAAEDAAAAALDASLARDAAESAAANVGGASDASVSTLIEQTGTDTRAALDALLDERRAGIVTELTENPTFTGTADVDDLVVSGDITVPAGALPVLAIAGLPRDLGPELSIEWDTTAAVWRLLDGTTYTVAALPAGKRFRGYYSEHDAAAPTPPSPGAFAGKVRDRWYAAKGTTYVPPTA